MREFKDFEGNIKEGKIGERVENDEKDNKKGKKKKREFLYDWIRMEI